MSQVVHPKPSDHPELYLANPDALYEVEDGVVVESPSMGAFAMFVANNLCHSLQNFLEGRRLGRAAVEMIFILDAVRDLRRRPDVAFVSFERWPADQAIPEVGDWDVRPDLPIEVLSPNDVSLKQTKKIREYFQYGARQVWVVDPLQRTVSIYHSPTKVKTLAEDDELDGGEILPGFRLPIARLFQTTFA